MSALGRSQDMFSDTAIQLQPFFANWIQSIHINFNSPGYEFFFVIIKKNK